MGPRALIRRAVFDTNAVVSALLFSKGRLDGLRSVWARGVVTPLVSAPTAHELLRVLTYPKFRLTTEEREELLADYLPYAEVISAPGKTEATPLCRDPEDQKFLALATAGNADALITGDQDLLSLQGQRPLPILPPSEFRTLLDQG